MAEKHWVVKVWEKEAGYPDRVIVWAANAKEAVEEAMRVFIKPAEKVEVQFA